MIITVWASALGRTVDDATKSVKAADSFSLARALALVVETGLVDGTVGVGATAGLAESSDTSLAGWALLVAQTRQLAHTGSAAFAFGAIERVPAHSFTLATNARASGWAVSVGTAALRLTDATAIGSRIGIESSRARARCSVVDDATGRIGSAKAVARIDATSVQASGLRRAVGVPTWTCSISPAASSVRISNSIQRARADDSSGRH